MAHIATACALVACVLGAAPARAEPRVPVVAEGCEGLDTDEVASVLELELAESVEAWSAASVPPVALACADGTVSITVDDPVTGKRLERSVPLPAEEGRERALALAVSQLFLTSWLELLLPEDQRAPMPERPAEEVAAATEHARRALALSAPEAEPARSHLARIGALGGGRLRSLGAPYPSVHAGVRAGIAIDHFSLFAQAAFERGEAARARGTIETWIGDFGVGAGWRSDRAGPFALEISAVFSALYLRMQGRPNGADVEGHDTSTAAAQVVLEAGPSVELADGLRLGLAIELGVTLFAPVGTVQDEPSVEPGGVFLGLRLELAVLP